MNKIPVPDLDEETLKLSLVLNIATVAYWQAHRKPKQALVSAVFAVLNLIILVCFEEETDEAK